MDSNKRILLPLAIAIIIPTIGLFSNAEPIREAILPVSIKYIITVITLYIFWYISWHLSIKNNNKWMILILPILYFGLIHAIRYIISHTFVPQELIRILIPVVLITIIQLVLKAQQDLATLSIEKEQIQTEYYKSQIEALHAKIDPHFLFNSMNTLRSLVRQGDPNAEQFIISFGDFYRQTLKHTDQVTIQVNDEIEIVKSYLFLMKSRNNGSVTVQWNISGAINLKQIPSLALQIIIENCFKHNSMSYKNPLRIDIKNTSDSYIEVTNNIQPKLDQNLPSGYGLEILKNRYELMNIQHGIIITTDKNEFKVKLKLINDESSNH